MEASRLAQSLAARAQPCCRLLLLHVLRVSLEVTLSPLKPRLSFTLCLPEFSPLLICLALFAA